MPIILNCVHYTQTYHNCLLTIRIKHSDFNIKNLYNIHKSPICNINLCPTIITISGLFMQQSLTMWASIPNKYRNTKNTYNFIHINHLQTMRHCHHNQFLARAYDMLQVHPYQCNKLSILYT